MSEPAHLHFFVLAWLCGEGNGSVLMSSVRTLAPVLLHRDRKWKSVLSSHHNISIVTDRETAAVTEGNGSLALSIYIFFL